MTFQNAHIVKDNVHIFKNVPKNVGSGILGSAMTIAYDAIAAKLLTNLTGMLDMARKFCRGQNLWKNIIHMKRKNKK